MKETATLSLNGVNLDQLIGTINAVKADPEIALFKFRAITNWVKGGHCRTRIKEFYGAKQEDTSRQKSFIIEGDEPAVLLGEDHGPNAVEAILHALASCLSVGVVYNASALGIKINSLQFTMEGDLDLHSFLGLSDSLRPGYRDIIVKIDLDADAPKEKILELVGYVQKTSPVLDIIRNPVPVSITLN